MATATSEDFLLAKAYKEVVMAAEEAMKLTGHHATCQFAGCTCGATEQFKTARLEFYRTLAVLVAAKRERAGRGR